MDSDSRMDTGRLALLAQQVATQQLEFLEIIENLPGVLFITTPSGEVIYANKRAGRSLGTQATSELVGHRLFSFADGTEALQFRAAFDARRVPEEQGAADFKLALPGKEPCTVELSLIRDIDFENERSVLIVGTDVTEHRTLQRQLHLSERLNSLGTLSAGVAHEINNPLSFVTSNLEFVHNCISDVAGLMEPGVAEDLKVALNEALVGSERIRNIVRDLKLFARGDDVGANDGRVDSAVDWAIKLTSNMLVHRCQVVTQFHPTPLVQGSHSKLSQVVLNLLTNAADALPDRKPEAGRVRIATTTDPAGNAVIEVEDNGCGIPESKLNRIFEPFFTTKPVGKGTGLGLSVSMGIVRGMNGQLQVFSEEGRGTLFRITLPPAATQPDTATAQPKPAASPAERRLRILIIDDEPQVVSSLERSLRRRYEVEGVSDPCRGLERLRSGNAYDVVLCDVMMPKLTGLELFEQLTTSSPLLARRFVFLTGGMLTDSIREAMSRLPNHIIEKPFALEEVERIVNQVA